MLFHFKITSQKFKTFIYFSSTLIIFSDEMIRLQNISFARQKLAKDSISHSKKLQNFLTSKPDQQTLQEACKQEVLSSELDFKTLLKTQEKIASINPKLAFQSHTQFSQFTGTLKNLGTNKHLSAYLGSPLDELKKIGTVCRQENSTNTNNQSGI